MTSKPRIYPSNQPGGLPVAAEPRKPAFGELCQINGSLRSTRERTGRYWYPIRKCWKRQRYSQPRTALYIGQRTIFDGLIDYVGDPAIDGTAVFKFTGHHVVWLFVLDERRNPVYVLPDDVYPLTAPTGQGSK